MTDFVLKDLVAVLPLLVLGLGALLLILVDVFLKKPWPRGIFSIIIVLTSFLSFSYNATSFDHNESIFSGTMAFDSWSLVLSFLVLLGTGLVFWLSSSVTTKKEGVRSEGEYYALILLSSLGAIIFGSATEFITWFIGLEIMSMSLYALCGFSISKKSSSESSMKYFLLGSFSSAFLLYGIALLYGLSGTTSFAGVSSALLTVNVLSPLSYLALGLIVIGIVFKIGLVPFHFWAPDVYQGAPTSITTYMATVVKTSAIFAAIRVLWLTFGDLSNVWSRALWLFAILTVVFGNLLALRQKSLKRMLGYSSIAHAGYISMALLVPDNEVLGKTSGAIIFYLLIYTLMTVGSFGILLTQMNEKSDNDEISLFNGFATKQPFLAALMAIFMLSLAGLPPALGGLFGKFYIFTSVLKQNYIGLVIAAVLSAVVACYYYLRVIVAMYFVESDSATFSVNANFWTKALLTLCAIFVILLGIMPTWVSNFTYLIAQ